MKAIGYTWGIGGILLLLLFAVFRLAPLALALENQTLGLSHWAALIFSITYMAWAEGYKGFYLAFAPRVVMRARYLFDHPRPVHILLAPLFCMGYIHATRKRQLMSIGLTLMIICFIVIARIMPQPWRGIVDAGVVVGLSIGITSICYFLVMAIKRPDFIQVSAEVPTST